MRQWTRAAVGALCGQCGALVPQDAVVQVIQLAGLKRRLVRCEACADGHAPEDVPGLPAPVLDAPTPLARNPTPLPFARLKHVTAEHFDWKARAADPVAIEE